MKIFILFIFISITTIAQENKEKAKQLEEVAITKQKKGIEQKADRTIFDFANQPNLNSGSVMEGIKKLPGLIASEVAGMLYQGKQLDVFLDGRPLNITSTELNSFLEGMPANSIEKVEVITQPGAEFPATSGGAILNIITNKRAKNYLSVTYSNATNVTNYDKLRFRTNNSLLLNSKNKLFSWQLNVGESYRENGTWGNVSKTEFGANTILSKTQTDRINRGYFAKSAITIDFKKDRLLLNYDVNYNRNNNETESFGQGFASIDAGKNKNKRQEAVATYQKRFASKDKNLDFRFNYSQNDFTNKLTNLQYNLPVLNNNSSQIFYTFKTDYSQPFKILDEGKLTAGFIHELLHFETFNIGTKNLDYNRRTSATYIEFQSKLKKFDFILGTRAEDYDIKGKTNTATLLPFKQFRFFPNATLQYNFMKGIFLNLNYNKKITLPSTSALNPNNTNYQNPNFVVAGNPQLQPTIFNNFEAKISAFDYAFISYNLSQAKNQVISKFDLNSNVVSSTNSNAPKVNIHNFSVGLPLPYMLFTKGLTETMKFDFNPDTINFLYMFGGYQLHEIPDLNTQGFWSINLSSQIILPANIKFLTTFNTITSGGNYFYFVAAKRFNESLDINFSKKFLNDQLSVSVFADDVLNSNISNFNAVNTPLLLITKNDTRRFGFSINYKIPTKNKLARENGNLLNKEKKEENSGGILN